MESTHKRAKRARDSTDPWQLEQMYWDNQKAGTVLKEALKNKYMPVSCIDHFLNKYEKIDNTLQISWNHSMLLFNSLEGLICNEALDLEEAKRTVLLRSKHDSFYSLFHNLFQVLFYNTSLTSCEKEELVEKCLRDRNNHPFTGQDLLYYHKKDPQRCDYYLHFLVSKFKEDEKTKALMADYIRKLSTFKPMNKIGKHGFNRKDRLLEFLAVLEN